MAKEYDNNELISLIQKHQKNPKEFTSLLVDNIFPTIEKICNKVSNDSVVHNITTNASALIQDVYIKLTQNTVIHEFDCIQLFYFTLRDVVRSILLANYHHRKTSNYLKLSNNIDFDIFLSSQSLNSEYHIEDVDNALITLQSIDPNAYLALSLKFYTASSNNQIASIMNKSPCKIEQYLSGGGKIVTSLMKHPDTLIHYC